jgi:hypothetical protein
MRSHPVRPNRILALAFLSLAYAAPASAAPQMDGPYIVNDVEFAKSEARKSGKPIFVVFRCEV